ncbi:stalk domain-containing protein [Paenibacillus wynnii]|uniref:stalk domain-containing protein n=1 Tax=Paenibacillus wynnii TaxID=268407 RepID=UPI002792105A|nr:stalk domain-containing protein [Paenibacillus wynnii]MDQ0196087.1 PKD repeat protein [Paenibacillus wynnii]
MDFKKLTLIAVLAVSQAATAIPVFAQADTTTTNVATATSTESTPPPGVVVDTPGTTPLPSATPVPGTTAGPTVAPTTVPTTVPTPSPNPVIPPTVTTGGTQLILMMNSNKMYMNGTEYIANQPMTVKNGVSNVSIRAMVERVGLQYMYDFKTKETIITSGSNILRFKTNSKIYTVNGKPVTMKGPAYQFNNTFMVPLTSITAALGIPYTVDNVLKRVILTLSTKPVASFTVQPTEIFAGQTTVNYITKSSSPSGAAIVNERWEGRQDIFEQPGSYVVSYYVMDANGQWSAPYFQTITVLKPNEAPVANFVTDKETYKIGELVNITNLSTDDGTAPLTTEWNGNALAYFYPGPVTIYLTVTDKQGLNSTVQKTITITDEVLYNQDDFNKLFMPVGATYSMDGSKIPTWSKVQYTAGSEATTLIRSNSPETVYSDGIVYRETAFGDTRFMVHHKNMTGKNVKMYVIATNTGLWPTTLTLKNSGFGGPLDIPTATGKKSVENYYQSLLLNRPFNNIILKPGESIPILTEISNVTMKPGQVVSLLSDVFSDYALQYDIVMIDANKNVLQSLPFLNFLDRDGVHNRGTYPNATRLIEVQDVLGLTPSRLLLGDKTDDPNLIGMDALTGTEASNSGNFGVVYKIKLNHVAPNTLITFNPRGGKYQGPMLVNGQIVQAPTTGTIDAPNQSSVVYRTGDFEQTVEIVFSAASGSNLPVNLLFMPLPPKK